jgi:ribonuclease P protein component
MMPAIVRLKTRPEFLKVAATGAKWVTPGLVLQARRRPVSAGPVSAGPDSAGPVSAGPVPAGKATDVGAEPVRVGFTVSRKVGNAIQRNRARRRLRAAVAEVLPEHGRAGCDYVLIGRAGTLDRRYADLLADLRTALARIGTKGSQGRPRGHRGQKGQKGQKGSE